MSEELLNKKTRKFLRTKNRQKKRSRKTRKRKYKRTGKTRKRKYKRTGKTRKRKYKRIKSRKTKQITDKGGIRFRDLITVNNWQQHSGRRVKFKGYMNGQPLIGQELSGMEPLEALSQIHQQEPVMSTLKVADINEPLYDGGVPFNYHTPEGDTLVYFRVPNNIQPPFAGDSHRVDLFTGRADILSRRNIKKYTEARKLLRHANIRLLGAKALKQLADDLIEKTGEKINHIA